VPNTDKKYGQLGLDRMLKDVGVVVEDLMMSDEIHEVVENMG
jgi:hypothetical protein